MGRYKINFSRPSAPTDNAFIEAFNSRFRAECLNASWFLFNRDRFCKRAVQLWKGVGTDSPGDLVRKKEPGELE